MRNFLLLFLSLFFLLGWSAVKDKSDMRSKSQISETFIVNKNYQSALKCWDDTADKTSKDAYSTLNTHIYSEKGFADITVTNPSNYYSVLIELKKISKNKTSISAYGSGYLAEQYIPKWIATLKNCAK